MGETPWEVKYPQLVPEFTKAYQDESITLTTIAKVMGFANTEGVRAAAKRFGLAGRVKVPKPIKKQVISLDTLRHQREELENKLKEVNNQMLDLEIRVERDGESIAIYGLGVACIWVPVSYARAWLDGGGPSKLRDAVGRKG